MTSNDFSLYSTTATESLPSSFFNRVESNSCNGGAEHWNLLKEEINPAMTATEVLGGTEVLTDFDGTELDL